MLYWIIFALKLVYPTSSIKHAIPYNAKKIERKSKLNNISYTNDVVCAWATHVSANIHAKKHIMMLPIHTCTVHQPINQPVEKIEKIGNSKHQILYLPLMCNCFQYKY